MRTEIDYLQDEVLTAQGAAEDESRNAQRLLDLLVTKLASTSDDHQGNFQRQSISGTIAATRQFSKYIEIPKTAEQSIEVLEASASSVVWATDLSRLFASMERYGHAVAQGNFKGDYMLWCQDNGDYSTQKVAMRESDPTKNDRELRAKRVFDISTDVDPTGQKLMLAHIKIQLRGGPQIPRLYFHDDTRGSTRKIHVGFIGPHFLVPSSTF